jgi:hypothetical protein
MPFALAQQSIAAAPANDGTGGSPLFNNDSTEVHAADLQPGMTGWQAYVTGVVWALREAGHRVGGADLVLTSDAGRRRLVLPSGSGMRCSHRSGRPQPPRYRRPGARERQTENVLSGHRPADGPSRLPFAPPVTRCSSIAGPTRPSRFGSIQAAQLEIWS